MSLIFDTAQLIISKAPSEGQASGLKPLTVSVLDAGRHLKAMARFDGTSTMRPEIAHGKAHGAIAMDLDSRAHFNRAQT